MKWATAGQGSITKNTKDNASFGTETKFAIDLYIYTKLQDISVKKLQENSTWPRGIPITVARAGCLQKNGSNRERN